MINWPPPTGGSLPVFLMLVLGLTYVITGSRAGLLLRTVGCYVLRAVRLKFLWPLLQCPPCNAWWTGAALAALLYPPSSPIDWVNLPVLGFISCGFVAVVNFWLGGQLSANEDFEAVFKRVERE